IEIIKRLNICRSCFEIEIQNPQKHQDRSKQCIKEKFERCINTVFSTPNTDDNKHRDQNALKEDIEQKQIHRAEHSNHECFKHKEGNHIFSNTVFDCFPATQNTDRNE